MHRLQWPLRDRFMRRLQWPLRDRFMRRLQWPLRYRFMCCLQWPLRDRIMRRLQWPLRDRFMRLLPWPLRDRFMRRLPLPLRDRFIRRLQWPLRDKSKFARQKTLISVVHTSLNHISSLVIVVLFSRIVPHDNIKLFLLIYMWIRCFVMVERIQLTKMSYSTINAYSTRRISSGRNDQRKAELQNRK